MEKLIVSLKNCYGISELNHEFDFTKKNTHIIYAPNGVMKTSLAKTFKDYSNNVQSKDEIFSDRITERVITDETGADFSPEEVFVIEPYNQEFSNVDRISSLLATKEIKNEYEQIHKELDTQKARFIATLKGISKSSDCEIELLKSFQDEGIFDFWSFIELKWTDYQKNFQKYEFRYNDVFDKKGKVQEFLIKHRDTIQSYIDSYENLLSTSNFFSKSENSFGTYQASEIAKSVSDDSFFQAGHKIELRNGEVIGSKEEYDNILQSAIEKVINEPSLKKIFNKIEKELGANVELRNFKIVIEKNNALLASLANYEKFRKEVWFGYLTELKVELNQLAKDYKVKKDEINQILQQARKQTTDWESSIEVFNDRFLSMPFILKLKNREDVILKAEMPNLEFVFKDDHSGMEQQIKKEDLVNVLSQGERRALYLLNIIFELNARKKNNQKTLFIIDDIADSFDYKNKYAIIEYLKEIALEPNFYQLILTHNFDFYRNVHSRILGDTNLEFALIARKNGKITLESLTEDIQKPFKTWKAEVNLEINTQNIDTLKETLIALIPFIRNLIEYSLGSSSKEYKTLTSLLHIKKASKTLLFEKKTEEILFSDLEPLYRMYIPKMKFVSVQNYVFKEICEVASTLCSTSGTVLDLKNKVILSMGIRLLLEKYLLDILGSSIDISKCRSVQTQYLIHHFKKNFPLDKTTHPILDQVNLMTPENIHLNSFMYEPILDMEDTHLKSLYRKVENLYSSIVSI